MQGERDLCVPPSNERVVSQHTLEWALDEVRPISYVRGNVVHSYTDLSRYICITQRETYRILIIRLIIRRMDLSSGYKS